MKIRLKTEPKGKWHQIFITKDKTIEEIIAHHVKHTQYTVLAARINNKVEALTKIIYESCDIELLDMRTQSVNLIYQNSLCLMFLKAINDVMGNVNVEIQNSLNKGLYTEIKTQEPVSSEDINSVSNRMEELIELDVPIEKEKYTVEEAGELMEKYGFPEKKKMMETVPGIKEAKFYSLEGYRDFFYSLMVPSTGYLKYFQLRKYRRGVLLRFPHPSKPDQIPPYVDETRLYTAFGEAKTWLKLLETPFVGDLNEKVRNGQYKELIQLSEALHEKKIAEIADEISKRHKRIILIAGPSSSGKTTFARRLCIQLRVNGMKPLYMGTDDYFVERNETPVDKNGERNYEDLDAVDIKLFNENMNGLLDGREVDLPEFDFLNGTKVFGKRKTVIKKSQPIVIEGIHALNGRLTEFIPPEEKFKIYISPFTQLNIDKHNRIPTTDARLLRRIVRDYAYRGHTAQSTIDAWPKVRAGEDKNIFPYNGEADMLFNSVHVYELSVLRKYAEPLLKNITPEEAEYGEAVRMIKLISFFETIEDDSIIVNNSIIREFIGGSIFVD